jgi:type I restriction enzyme S subunit
MKTYDNYKESGIEWIGEIPEHWEIKKMKYCADLINGYSFKPEQYTNEGIPVVRIGDLDYEVNIENAKKVDFELLENLKDFLIRKGDILLALTGATIGKSALFDKDDLVFLNQRVGILRTKVNVEKQYLRYVIMSNIFREFVDLFCGGSAQENIGKAQLDNYFLQLPRLPEQTAIANYLDNKTTEIDQVVADKEALIVLYEEEKKALINEAVTKGVTLSGVETSTAKLKPSGIDWLGDVQEHWEVKRLKYIKSPSKNSFVDGPFGSNLKTEHFIENGDVYVIDSGFVTSGDFVSHREFRSISYDHFKTIERSEAKENDIIISKIGANFGMSGILPKLDKPSVVSGNSLKLTVDTSKYLIKYIHYQLLNIKENGQIDLLVKGSAQPAVTLGLLNELPFPITCSLAEQTAIIHHIETETTKINDKINQIKQEIGLLKEYRQALIFEAVTGKICVH